MAIRQSIREKLQSLTGVAATCGERVYLLRVTDQALLPCIVFGITGGVIDDVDSCGANDLMRASVEVYAISRDPEEAIDLVEEISSSAGLHGASWTEASTTVQLCRITGLLEDDYMEPPFNAYAFGASFEITYS